MQMPSISHLVSTLSVLPNAFDANLPHLSCGTDSSETAAPFQRISADHLCPIVNAQPAPKFFRSTIPMPCNNQTTKYEASNGRWLMTSNRSVGTLGSHYQTSVSCRCHLDKGCFVSRCKYVEQFACQMARSKEGQSIFSKHSY